MESARALPLHRSGDERAAQGIVTDGSVDSENYMKQVKDGAEITVQCAYVLSDTSTPVEVEAGEVISLDNQKLTKTFNIAQ
ncbi:MAG: DUF5067 domain-containing protein [Faecalibacterium sp.]|jgi:pentose-5-phosphate-3-epimerase|nr:DUF5067 domain-containing protein [Faecalibacterium sp.]